MHKIDHKAVLAGQGEADAVLEELISKYEKEMAVNIAYILAYRGEADRAFEWLDKAVKYKDGGLSQIAVDPLFANLRGDPRWLPFLRKHGMAPEQFVVGNGSNEIIELLGHVFLGPGDEVVMANPAFVVYKLVTLLFGARAVEVPLRDWRHDLPAMAAAKPAGPEPSTMTSYSDLI